MSLLSWLFRKKTPKGRTLPEGWTETKIDENHYITHIPEDQKHKWKNERREKDNVISLIAKNGFHIKNHGRSGFIYYVNQGKICEFYFEVSGVPEYDILVNYGAEKSWFYPFEVDFAPNEKSTIKERLILWLKQENAKPDLY